MTLLTQSQSTSSCHFTWNVWDPTSVFNAGVGQPARIISRFSQYIYSPNPKRFYMFNIMSFSMYMLRVETTIKWTCRKVDTGHDHMDWVNRNKTVEDLRCWIFGFVSFSLANSLLCDIGYATIDEELTGEFNHYCVKLNGILRLSPSAGIATALHHY